MASFFSKATQPIQMHLTTKMLPPFGEEGWSPNENAGFPITTNTTCNRSNENAGFPDTTKLYAEEEGCSANGNVEFPDTTKNTCYQSARQCWWSITCVTADGSKLEIVTCRIHCGKVMLSLAWGKGYAWSQVPRRWVCLTPGPFRGWVCQVQPWKVHSLEGTTQVLTSSGNYRSGRYASYWNALLL